MIPLQFSLHLPLQWRYKEILLLSFFCWDLAGKKGKLDETGIFRKNMEFVQKVEKHKLFSTSTLKTNI